MPQIEDVIALQLGYFWMMFDYILGGLSPLSCFDAVLQEISRIGEDHDFRRIIHITNISFCRIILIYVLINQIIDGFFIFLIANTFQQIIGLNIAQFYKDLFPSHVHAIYCFVFVLYTSTAIDKLFQFEPLSVLNFYGTSTVHFTVRGNNYKSV